MLKNALGALLFLFVFLLPACNTAQKASTTQKGPTDPVFHLEVPFHDFDTIKLGDKPGFTYVFTNTSGEDLEIELVSGCNCTQITWPERKVFKPMEKGEISIVYDSTLEEGLGEHNKTIDILLAKIDPETGYQIIKEAKFRVVIEE